MFWGGVLDFIEDPDDPNQPGDEECVIFSIDGTQRLLFIEVPDAKQVRNRVHLDLKPAGGTRDQEFERLLELGAREVAGRRRPDGSGWIVLADLEGNEFCILWTWWKWLFAVAAAHGGRRDLQQGGRRPRPWTFPLIQRPWSVGRAG